MSMIRNAVGHGYICTCGQHSIENCRRGRECTAEKVARKFRVFYTWDDNPSTPFDCEATSSLDAQTKGVAHFQAQYPRRKVKSWHVSVVLADAPVSTVLG